MFSNLTGWNYRNKFFWAVLLTILVITAWPMGVSAQVGHILEGIGPIANGMGGAVTGNPPDACSAVYWNPAGIAAFPTSMVAGGLELMMPDTHLSSSLRANAFGASMPAANMSGKDKSNTTLEYIPGFALAYKPKDPGARWAFGIGMYGISGFGTNYDQSAVNPILTPQMPNGFGFGKIYSSMAIAQVCPTLAYNVTDEWSVGASVIYDYAQLDVDPFPGATPNDANNDGFATYPTVYRKSANGMGFQVASLYRHPDGFRFGLSLKSPQWFEKFKFNARNEIGASQPVSYHIDYPMIISGGLGYVQKKWDADVDLRYYDYANTAGFEDSGFDRTGAVQGFGWDSIWEVAMGMQYHINPRLTIRGGYIYNSNPINDKDTFFNVACPAIIQHHVSCGLSYKLTNNWMIATSYTHGFRNRISGPYQTVNGPVAGTSVTSEMSTNIVVVGTAIFF